MTAATANPSSDGPPAPRPAPSPATPHDTPTGYHIQADRPCARCGFNLFGQPIVREPHYNLTAARCPECGQLAALQEYPALGRWANRWARVLAAAWIVLLLGAAAAQFGPTFGMLIAAVEIASEDFGQTIAAAFTAWETANRDGVTTNAGTFGGWNLIETAWWNEHRDQLIASKGGVRGVIDRRAGWLLGPFCLVSFAAGLFWSVCLLGARRRATVIPALLPLALAMTIVWFVQGTALIGAGNMTYAHDLATTTVRSFIVAVFGGSAGACVLLGVWQGRRLARVAVRLALPPRMRSALAILWTRDGLPPPSATAA
jgi:hypothetical protein